MEQNVFQIIIENIDYVSDNILNYESPAPTNEPENQVCFENIITLDKWKSLINDNKKNYKNLIQFIIDKYIYIKPFLSEQWEFNRDILPDIIQSFQYFLFKNCSTNKLIFELKNLPPFYFGNDVTKAINSYAENNKPFLKLTKLYPILKEYGIELDSEDAHFLNFICANISEEIIIEYLIYGQDMDFLKHSIFYDWYDFDSLNKIILYSKNPNKRRHFNGILTRKNLCIENLENLYLINEIYIPSGVTLKNNINPTDTKQIEGDFNPILIDDIFYTYKRSYIDDVPEQIYNDTDSIDIAYNLAYDFEEKNKLLRDEIKKHSKIVQELELTNNLSSLDKKLDLNNESFLGMIKNEIHDQDEIIEDFLVNGADMQFECYTIFEEWFLLSYHLEVLKYLKLKLSKLKNEKNSTMEESNSTKYYSKIWVDKKHEIMFHEYLILRNVIDNKSNTLDGFKAQAAVILRVKSRLKKQIIKERVSAKTFAKFLNKKYNAEIVITERGFKIGNSNYPTEECEEFIEAFLNKEY